MILEKLLEALQSGIIFCLSFISFAHKTYCWPKVCYCCIQDKLAQEPGAAGLASMETLDDSGDSKEKGSNAGDDGMESVKLDPSESVSYHQSLLSFSHYTRYNVG